MAAENTGGTPSSNGGTPEQRRKDAHSKRDEVEKRLRKKRQSRKKKRTAQAKAKDATPGGPTPSDTSAAGRKVHAAPKTKSQSAAGASIGTARQARRSTQHEHVGKTKPLNEEMRRAMRHADRTYHFLPPEDPLTTEPEYLESLEGKLPPGVHFSSEWDKGLILSEMQGWCDRHGARLTRDVRDLSQSDLRHAFLRVVTKEAYLFHGWHYRYLGNRKLMMLDEAVLEQRFLKKGK